MPESISNCGVLKAPPARITSREARMMAGSPARVAGATVRAIEALALEILDADGAVALEHHAGGQRIEHDPQAVGVAPRDFEQALASPGARVIARW